MRRSITVFLFMLACSADVDDDNVDDVPELQSECPGGLLCPCFVPEGPEPCAAGSTCGEARQCTFACDVDADCLDVLPDAACVAGLCGLPCDDVLTYCDELGMPGAVCRDVATDATDELVCAYGEA
jgi:hypothetical protein